jgi:rhomboid protease GluP
MSNEHSLPGEKTIATTRNTAQADEWGLVLQASSIDHRLVPDELAGWAILVNEQDEQAAQHALETHRAENLTRLKNLPPVGLVQWNIEAAIFPAFAIALVYGLTGPIENESRLFAEGILIAGAVRHTEPWRAITALTLHADFPHVLSNIFAAAGAIGALGGLAGPGRAIFWTLCAAALGNFGVALLKPSSYQSLGFSTAVFASVGVSGAILTRQRWPEWHMRIAIAPFSVALALLVYFGFGGRDVSIVSHVCGFVAGLAVGALVAPFARAQTSTFTQFIYAAASIAFVGGAWAMALC